MKKPMRIRCGATALYVAVVGCALCVAAVPTVAQEPRADTASEGRRTPIDTWIARPYEIELSTEQLKRVDELRTEYLEEYGQLRGNNQMAVVMQALGLEMKYRELVRSLLTPEQQNLFDVNVRKGGSADAAFEPVSGRREGANAMLAPDHHVRGSCREICVNGIRRRSSADRGDGVSVLDVPCSPTPLLVE